MSSLIELIANQAKVTFTKSVADEGFTESLNKLIRYVNKIRATDLKLSRDSLRNVNSGGAARQSSAVTYIEVEENQTFSIGIFLLKPGAKIPLHDHPGMYGILKVIHGTVRITSYSALSNVPGDNIIPQDIKNRVKSPQKVSLIPVEKHMPVNIAEKDEPCVLKPRERNYHEICAVGGIAAFLDVLAPPYDLIEQNCHYYVALETKIPDSVVKTWLMRRPQPSNFWCEPAPYTGPKLSL